MSITVKRIEKVQFKKNMFKLYFDNGNNLTVLADTVVKFHLKPDISVSESDYDKLVSYDKSNRAMLDGLDLISKKAYSEKSFKEKLAQKGYNRDVSNKVFLRLKELDYINDKNYAKNYASYLYKKGKGTLLINAELVRQGLDKDLIKETLEGIKEENEPFEIILKMLETKLQAKFKNFDGKDKNETRKIISFFLRKGFAFEDISKAIHIIVNRDNS
jgi:regulatory protein